MTALEVARAGAAMIDALAGAAVAVGNVVLATAVAAGALTICDCVNVAGMDACDLAQANPAVIDTSVLIPSRKLAIALATDTVPPAPRKT